jgi:hypothetical protein
MSDSYDPHSHHALFSRIIQRLDAQDRESHAHREEVKSMLTDIRTETRLTNGRVSKLERWVDTSKAKVAGAAMVVSLIVSLVAWLVNRYW